MAFLFGVARISDQVQFTAQRVPQRLRYPHIHHLPDQAGRIRAGRKVHHAVAFGAAGPFPGVFARRAFYQNTLCGVHQIFADALDIGFDCGLQMLQPLELDLVGRFVMQIGRWRAGAWAENKTEAGVKTDIVNQLHQLGKVLVGLAWETHNEVTAH